MTQENVAELVAEFDALLNQAVKLGAMDSAADEGWAVAQRNLGKTVIETQRLRAQLLNKLGVVEPPKWEPDI